MTEMGREQYKEYLETLKQRGIRNNDHWRNKVLTNVILVRAALSHSDSILEVWQWSDKTSLWTRIK